MGSPEGLVRAPKREAWIFHQRQQAMNFWFSRRQLGQDAAEAQRFLAQLRSHPVVARCRRVTLVENEIDDLKHGREPLRELSPAGHLEGDALLGQRALGADDALGNGRLRHQEGARDLLGRQATDQAQC